MARRRWSRAAVSAYPALKENLSADFNQYTIHLSPCAFISLLRLTISQKDRIGSLRIIHLAGISNMAKRCCVFQPFDESGPYDRRYSEVIEPAIVAAGLEAYRVDRDPAATIPIDTLESEIRSASVCLADISLDNPNVWYELGYALASGVPVVMICLKPRKTKTPFDVQHRSIIYYAQDSPGDFQKLQKSITDRIEAEVHKQSQVADIASASPVSPTEGLRPHEITALALVMAERNSPDDGVGIWITKRNMDKAGFNELATNLAITSLVLMGFAENRQAHDPDNGESYSAVYLLEKGERWLIDNQERLALQLERTKPK
jgi:hypothetical protein